MLAQLPADELFESDVAALTLYGDLLDGPAGLEPGVLELPYAGGRIHSPRTGVARPGDC